MQNGVVRVTSQDITLRSPRRISRASDRPMTRALSRWAGQLFHQDGDEDQVVDPEHDFQDDQGKQTDPDVGIQQQFHVVTSIKQTEQRVSTAYDGRSDSKAMALFRGAD